MCTLLTALTIQATPDTAAASLRGEDPGAIQPGCRVADVLLVPTCQVRHPLLRLILMKADDLALHGDLPLSSESVRSYERSRTVNDAGREVLSDL